MKLVRKVKEILFSTQGDSVIISQANFMIEEFIKIILMGEECKNDIPHWLSNSLGASKK